MLSHARHDHTGGLEKVLRHTDRVKVYIHPDIFKPKYTISAGKEPRYNGLPKTKEKYEKQGEIFVPRDQQMELEKDIYLLGPIIREKPSEDEQLSKRYIKQGHEFIPDPLTDEQVLTIHTSKG